VAVTSFYLAVSYRRQMAVVFAVGLCLLVSLADADPMREFAVLAGGTIVGVVLLDSVRSRTKPIVVGLIAGLTYAAMTLATGLLWEGTASLILLDAGRVFAGGLIAGFLMSGSLPFVESLFGIVTDISLLELADSSHPLLQDLIRRAPGTYNHSVSVSIIGEAAAKAIGCNSLVVRVGALFHDVGKMLKPKYFIENKGADEINRHEQLAPAISTLIIIGHVKDGLELAREHHLPTVLMDMIEQHHGTTLVDYFFHEATRELQSRSDAEEEVHESAFRYPGPKPQTKEAAVMMLTDCVESASRALTDPTPTRIEKLVHNLVLNRLLDGQFEECGITLQEIQTIEESLKKSLTSVYHGRIKYPAAV
jgi:putative nucleotidyltransferase with HDIG domain